MKPVDKALYLARLEQQVESHIQKAVQHFQNLDEITLDWPSPTGGWSITQCLAHLNSYGHYYLPRLKQDLEKPLAQSRINVFQSSWLGAYLARLMDPQTSRRKFKAHKRHQPARGLPAQQVVAEFINQQEEILCLLRQAEQIDVQAIRIPLSIAPWVRLPLGDILLFLVMHNERHIQQANQCLQNIPLSRNK